MPEPRYGKTIPSVGRGGPPQPRGPRSGVVAVAAKRPMEVPVARPARDPQIDELQLPGYPADHLPQGNSTDPMCGCCGATEASEIIVRIEITEPVSLCGACIELLVDKLRSELPRRRLRLAMERLASGEVTPEMLKIIEDLSSGAMVVGKKAEVGGE